MSDTEWLSELEALENPDWTQVILNGGPPCFFVEDGRFCLRAQRWEGHECFHKYLPLEEFIGRLLAIVRAGERVAEALRDCLDKLSGPCSADEVRRLRNGEVRAREALKRWKEAQGE